MLAPGERPPFWNSAKTGMEYVRCMAGLTVILAAADCDHGRARGREIHCDVLSDVTHVVAQNLVVFVCKGLFLLAQPLAQLLRQYRRP